MTQPDDALTTSREHRDRHIGRVDVLDKVKALMYLPGGTEVTTEMAAAYFEVEIDTIKKLTQRAAEELEASGYRVIEGHALRDMKSLSGIGGRSRSLALFQKRAMLRMAMLLRDSVIARAVRDEILNKIEQAIAYDLGTPDGQIVHLQQMLEMAKRNKVLEIENTAQRAELEAAAPKVEYVDTFVGEGDGTTLRLLAKQIGVRESALREHLISLRVIYREYIGDYWNKKKKAEVAEYEYHAHADRAHWFKEGDQPRAPRRHNGQLRTTLYVLPAGKVAIKQLLVRHPVSPKPSGQLAIEGVSA